MIFQSLVLNAEHLDLMISTESMRIQIIQTILQRTAALQPPFCPHCLSKRRLGRSFLFFISSRMKGRVALQGIPKQYVSLITLRLNHGWHTYSWLCCTINPFHHHWMVYMPQKKKKTTVAVISEYTTPKIPEEDATSTEKEDAATSPEKINEPDWYRRLSLSSIPRKSSLPGSHSRRSSTSDAERTFAHFAKSRPRILA
ncbi:hypothetical protein CEXT_165731 [Caerostris extrusa]|uniref:Uncharacterized protein n=1 Tax=Caerostris extrusa TaxID=172846 RepID=A0AAV4SNP7_CAEEX|nr:hypothetical protein CEXT_165731 [Caerostris extrusa]